jgi:hypothetical protein
MSTVQQHLFGNVASLALSVGVFLVVLLLARGPGAPTARWALKVGWFVVGILALASIVFRAVLLVTG